MPNKIQKSFFALLLLLNFTIVISQTDNTYKSAKQIKIDSLTQKFKKDSTHLYRFQKVRPYLSIDNRIHLLKMCP